MEVVYKLRLMERPEYNEMLIQFLGAVPRVQFKTMVDGLQVFLNIELMSHATLMPVEAIEMLDVLHSANEDTGHLQLPEFYNDSVSNILHHNLKQEYRRWVKKKATGQGSESFCIIDYPWIINPPQKSLIILIESQYEMSKSIRSDNFF